MLVGMSICWQLNWSSFDPGAAEWGLVSSLNSNQHHNPKPHCIEVYTYKRCIRVELAVQCRGFVGTEVDASPSTSKSGKPCEMTQQSPIPGLH